MGVAARGTGLVVRDWGVVCGEFVHEPTPMEQRMAKRIAAAAAGLSATSSQRVGMKGNLFLTP
jgi:hypothetical protein